jgi:hypothetical protein
LSQDKKINLIAMYVPGKKALGRRGSGSNGPVSKVSGVKNSEGDADISSRVNFRSMDGLGSASNRESITSSNAIHPLLGARLTLYRDTPDFCGANSTPRLQPYVASPPNRIRDQYVYYGMDCIMGGDSPFQNKQTETITVDIPSIKGISLFNLSSADPGMTISVDPIDRNYQTDKRRSLQTPNGLLTNPKSSFFKGYETIAPLEDFNTLIEDIDAGQIEDNIIPKQQKNLLSIEDNSQIQNSAKLHQRSRTLTPDGLQGPNIEERRFNPSKFYKGLSCDDYATLICSRVKYTIGGDDLFSASSSGFDEMVSDGYSRPSISGWAYR